MLIYPRIDSVAFHLGPLAVHWYGIMYLLAFLTCWGLLTRRLKTTHLGFTSEQLSDLLFYSAFGVIIGGRLGYMLFYMWPDFIQHPWIVFELWHGGMAFHGGCIGVIVAWIIYSYKINRSLFDIGDFITPVIPLGLALGRLGNFINGELWGRESHLPWAMVFPNGGDIPRHPSQLYEALMEGLLLFVICWIFSMKPRPRFAVSGLFLLGYGIFRSIAEFFREPDPQIGFVAFDWMTKGQMLSIPMMIAGMVFLTIAYAGKQKQWNSI